MSIEKHAAEAENHCSQAAELLARHGVQARSHPIASRADVAQTIIEKSHELDARAIVMGAFGRKGLTAKFFGSATRRLLEQSPFSLFLY